MLLAPYVCFHIFSSVKVTEWPPIGKIAAHSAYEMFSWYKYLIVSLVFSRLGFWSGNLFLIAPFPDLCLLVPFCLYPNDFSIPYMLHRPKTDFGFSGQCMPTKLSLINYHNIV